MGDLIATAEYASSGSADSPFASTLLHRGQPAYQPGLPSQAQQQHSSADDAQAAQQGRTQLSMASPYNMGAMASLLPQTVYQNGYEPRPYHSGPQSAAMMAQMSQMSHMSGLSFMSHLPSHMPQMGHMSQYAGVNEYYTDQYYAVPQRNQHGNDNNMTLYSNQMLVNHAQHAQAQHMMGGGYYSEPRPAPFPAPDQGQHRRAYLGANGLSIIARASLQAAPVSDGRTTIVRGPPRKPRQSGHAIWIGNLPPQTDLMHLVHHVCNETTGLESLFLISKSNCAFANFGDEQGCVKAQKQLHDSRVNSVRLVSRLRKSTVEGTAGQTAPTGPAATSSAGPTTPPLASPLPSTSPQKQTQLKHLQHVAKSKGTSHHDRFFVLKSLTVDDLDLSVRNGVWATQSHNEETLNTAFTTADNVYLIFSANKSGEYFGYARMVSPINNDPSAAIEFAPKSQPVNDVDAPKAIPTPATSKCPQGRIIDDSARGTIFWEVERDSTQLTQMEEESAGHEDMTSHAPDGGGGEPGVSKAWGKPFRLEWLSTARLPFYRTRGLRNVWNANREVKIARDGTELEPSIGRRLIALFHHVQNPAMAPAAAHRGQLLLHAHQNQVPVFPPR